MPDVFCSPSSDGRIDLVPIRQWLTLFDQAERLRASPDAYWDDPVASRRVGQAIAALLAYEHTLLPLQRRLAREQLWLRDRSSPLPDAAFRQEWEHCGCCACLLERRLARFRPAADARPHPALVAPVPPTPTSPHQGELIPC